MQVTRGTEFRFIPADSLTGEEGNIGISFNATRFVFQFQSMFVLMPSMDITNVKKFEFFVFCMPSSTLLLLRCLSVQFE